MSNGIVYFRSVANNGYSGDLEMDLIPEWFRTDILKESLDTDFALVGRVIEKQEKFIVIKG